MVKDISAMIAKDKTIMQASSKFTQHLIEKIHTKLTTKTRKLV